MLSRFLSFIFVCALLTDCKEHKGKNAEIYKKEKRLLYQINLPDTISSGIPIVFDVKLLDTVDTKKEQYFSYLILSDSVNITLDNLYKKKDLPYEIKEIDTNHWKVRRTFNHKGHFIIKGGIYIHTLEYKEPHNDSIKAFEKEGIVQIRKKVYIK